MIRVNLLKHAGAGASVAKSSDGGAEGSLSTEVQKQAGLRIGAVLGAILLVFIYGVFVAGGQRTRLDQINQAIAKADAEKAKFGADAPLLEQYSNEKAKMDKQISTLRKLASDRLLDVKALDALQTLITPEDWLKTVKIEKGQITIVGYAKNDNGVTDFIRALDSSVFFSGLQVKSSGEEKIGTESVKKFELVCGMGRPNE
jgi:Tfp pilus assembly protein PilN